ncbi:MAG: ammonium transporter [Pseudomonadota bacterium]|jgi:Amt family ammonium transporter|nr:ammonium transporter [Xanthomonadaceae bacterium]MDE3209226.1 ammonium transporter [Pseudomonadota bacterium]
MKDFLLFRHSRGFPAWLPSILLLGLCLLAPSAHAQAAVSAAAPVVDKGDVAWMLTSTLLVLMMTVPGVALFYGGLVRSKNILSVLMQVLTVFSLIVVLWVIYGYAFAFDSGNAFVGSASKLFLKGVSTTTLADTFTATVKLPEFVFVVFQATFAGITGTLIVGSLAERMKFGAVLLFVTLWFTFAYIPIAHMVWGPGGFLLSRGALDFAGGTVVHINAGIAGLVGAYLLGPRIGLGREAIKPHNLTFTMIGASLLWVGWFGFNAGSNLESNAGAALAFINTLVATAAAVLAWLLIERLLNGKPSMLGGASGAVAGLVAITPACGTVGPMGSLAIGVVASIVCVWGVSGLKKLLKTDDALDVFGVHGVGGITGALLTGVFTAPALGGTGAAGFSIIHQLGIQALGVAITLVWSGAVSLVAYLIVRAVFGGLRVSEEDEHQGLDITSHGEAAYEA